MRGLPVGHHWNGHRSSWPYVKLLSVACLERAARLSEKLLHLHSRHAFDVLASGSHRFPYQEGIQSRCATSP